MTEAEIRNKEKQSIYQCCLNFESFKKLDLISKYELVESIESGILDAAIDKSRERNIPTYWNTEEFIEQYSNIGYQVKINLDVNSSINRDNKEYIKSYLIDRLCNYAKVKMMVKSLKKSRNTVLPHNLIKKIIICIPVINPFKIGYFKSLEFNPYINQVYIDDLQVREQQHIVVKYSKMYKCSQCGHKKTQMREIQTRSSDEGGTLFITCLECLHTWRQYG